MDRILLGGGNSKIFYFLPRTLGFHDPIWRAYVSNRLVQPPTRLVSEEEQHIAWLRFSFLNEADLQVETFVNNM